MNGLDKLKEKIIFDAKTEAEKILSDAERNAAKILAEFKEKAGNEEKHILSEADKKAMHIVRTAESNANSDGRKKILKEKRKIMDSVFQKARETAENLPDSEYFGIIYSLAEKCGGGELLMSENDKNRIPEDFAKKIEVCGNGKITVSKEYANIKNGFVLRNGLTEENCSFDAIIEEKSERLLDETAKILFPNG